MSQAEDDEGIMGDCLDDFVERQRQMSDYELSREDKKLRALESIAASLEKIANPAVQVAEDPRRDPDLLGPALRKMIDQDAEVMNVTTHNAITLGLGVEYDGLALDPKRVTITRPTWPDAKSHTEQQAQRIEELTEVVRDFGAALETIGLITSGHCNVAQSALAKHRWREL
jgi:hypothetical protein